MEPPRLNLAVMLFYMVQAFVDGVDSGFLAVEIPIEKYEPGTPAEDYAGIFVYRCSNDQTMETGSCNGAVLGLDDALFDIVAAELNLLEGAILEIVNPVLEGVFVKAMNPSVEGMLDGGKVKRQNFPLVNVCEVSDEQ